MLSVKKAGHEVHTNYKRTTYENETLRITLKHQQNRVSPQPACLNEMIYIEQDFCKKD